MRYKLSACSIWEYGQRTDAAGRPHQEDSLYPQLSPSVGASPRAASTDERLFIVCDGMGGHDAGEVASATVCYAMSEHITRHTSPEGEFTRNDLQQALDAAFDALDRKDTGAEKKMGTTLTLLKFHAGGYTMAHMGDSRIYHFRPGEDRDSTRIVHVTNDHSLVNDLVKIGELTPEQARTSKKKNIITRALQPHMEHKPQAEIYESDDLRVGDYFYLCSDGMLEQTDDDNLRYIFSEQGGRLQAKADLLRRAAQDNRDNHTALLIRVDAVKGAPQTAGLEKNSKPRSPLRWLLLLVALLVAAWLVGKRLLPPRSETPPADTEQTEQVEQTEPSAAPSHPQQPVVTPPEAPGEDTVTVGAEATDADATPQVPAEPPTPQIPQEQIEPQESYEPSEPSEQPASGASGEEQTSLSASDLHAILSQT